MSKRSLLAILLGLVCVSASPTFGTSPPTEAEAEASPDSGAILSSGSRSLIWYSGAPQLQELHAYLADRLAQVREGVVEEIKEIDATREWREPYDLLVMAAADQKQLNEWRQIAPSARVILSATPKGEDVAFTITFNHGLKKQVRVINLSGPSRSELFAELDSLKPSAAPSSEGGGADADEPEVARAMGPGGPDTMGNLKAVLSCIYAAIEDADLSWSITIGADGQIQSITISGDGLNVLYSIVACF
jgi:hypothetical protein